MLLLGTIALSTSCKKDDFLEDQGVHLGFSQDTLLFDTVFTTKLKSSGYLTGSNTTQAIDNLFNSYLKHAL